MEEGIKATENKNLERGSDAALPAQGDLLPAAEFVKVEKNLASLGFFTPSSKRTRDERSKTVSVTVVVGGKRIEAKATIAPTALFGLPITADQDKWLALHKILEDIQTRDGEVTNPVSFSSAEILALLRIYKDSGKNYKDVSDWLDVMVGTTIISEGAVYFAGKRTFGKDTFHVFDRAVSFGKQLPDGSIADKNYVWLSQWQLQNINEHHQLPIDLEVYRQLRNYIAKALVPLLQIWLYATRDDGVFEKRYDELCQILNIHQWSYPSKIREKLGPSLDELKQFGYLADWQIANTSDKHAYKIIFYHGEKFHRDRRARLARRRSQSDSSIQPTIDDRRQPFAAREDGVRTLQSRTEAQQVRPQAILDPQLVAEFTRRGITEKKAADLLAKLKPGQAQNLVAQLEHAEQLVQHSRSPIMNPAGFIIRLIEMNTPVPDGFETSAKRISREEKERRDRAQRDAEDAREQLELAYEQYCDREVARYIQEHADSFEAMKDAKWKEDQQRFSFATESMTRIEVRYEIRKQLPLLTFEEFVVQRDQVTEFSMKPVAPSPATEPAPVTPSREITTASEAVEIPMEPSASSPVVDSAIEPEFKPEMESATPQPMMIELVSEPPSREPDGNAVEPDLA